VPSSTCPSMAWIANDPTRNLQPVPHALSRHPNERLAEMTAGRQMPTPPWAALAGLDAWDTHRHRRGGGQPEGRRGER
jgi:hypothetical protein